MSDKKPKETLLVLDSRRRVALGKLAQHNYYFANVDEDGAILLTPAVVMTVAEKELLEDVRKREPKTPLSDIVSSGRVRY